MYSWLLTSEVSDKAVESRSFREAAVAARKEKEGTQPVSKPPRVRLSSGKPLTGG